MKFDIENALIPFLNDESQKNRLSLIVDEEVVYAVPDFFRFRTNENLDTYHRRIREHVHSYLMACFDPHQNVEWIWDLYMKHYAAFLKPGLVPSDVKSKLWIGYCPGGSRFLENREHHCFIGLKNPCRLYYRQNKIRNINFDVSDYKNVIGRKTWPVKNLKPGSKLMLRESSMLFQSREVFALLDFSYSLAHASSIKKSCVMQAVSEMVQRVPPTLNINFDATRNALEQSLVVLRDLTADFMSGYDASLVREKADAFYASNLANLGLKAPARSRQQIQMTSTVIKYSATKIGLMPKSDVRYEVHAPAFSFELRGSPWVESLIARINTGKSFQVRSLTVFTRRKQGRPFSPEDILMLLQLLVFSRALRVL